MVNGRGIRYTIHMKRTNLVLDEQLLEEAVRVLGVTGRIRLLRFDPVSGQWLESF